MLQKNQQQGEPVCFHSRSLPVVSKSGHDAEVPVFPRCVVSSRFCWKMLVFLPALPAIARDLRCRAAGVSRGQARWGAVGLPSPRGI